MIVGVAKESFPFEKRVALVPAAVPALAQAGLKVLIQSGAGRDAGYPDAMYQEREARLAASRDEVFSADALLQVRAAGAAGESGEADLGRLRDGQVIVGMADPLGQPQALVKWAEAGTTLFALELLPRITRAQSMDVLSSMATVAGYRAVLLAASSLPRMFPMMMTAAGTISPAKVLVVGAGVAGLQAIATAKRLGGVVSAYDVRPVVKEQVESLGAKFLQIELDTDRAEDAGGYAKAMDDETLRRQRELMIQAVAESDVVITTAAVPGKRAPVLVTTEMVEQMRPGSVVVDLAAERGGNCELTKPGETLEHHDVKILGPANLPSEVPYHASQMYAKNVSNFLLHLLDGGQLKTDTEDEIVRETMVTRDGRVVHPKVLELLGDHSTSPQPEPTSEDQGEKH